MIKEQPSVIDFALDVLSMAERIEYLEAENERLRKIESDYNDLLLRSIKHGDEMMGHLLMATLQGCIQVTSALSGDNKQS